MTLRASSADDFGGPGLRLRAHSVRNCEKIDLAIAFDIPSLTVGVRYQPLTNPDGNGGDQRSGFFHSPVSCGAHSGVEKCHPALYTRNGGYGI